MIPLPRPLLAAVVLPVAIAAAADESTLPVAIAAAADESTPAYEAILKIDAHSHVFEDLPQLNALMRRINLRTINVCNNGSNEHLATMHAIALELYRKHPDLYPFTATFDLQRRNEPSYAKDVIAFLDEKFQQGAVAVKIWKEVGLEIKNPQGKFILPDDPLFDPIYAFIARRGKLLHAHLAEPVAAWLPLDPKSINYAYYSANPEWHLYGKPEYPSHAAIIAARDNILRKHPDLIVVGAHLGSLEHDLGAIAERLARYPNFYIEVSGRTKNLTRHPADKVRALFLKYPDRILYGVDANWKPFLRPQRTAPSQREGHVSTLELRYKADFDYYAGHGEIDYLGYKTEALHLPRSVLEKFYHENAERLFKLRAAWQGKN
jgi:predicted TIM-barrel fold metal-dependent hydrolase